MPLFEYDEDVSIKSKDEAETPKMYRVLLHNDHFTTREFVVEVLVVVFHKSAQDATQIMLDVHRKGMGTVGMYTRDIAETKVDQVHSLAKQRSYPLRCSCEEA
ncbi:MAG: ATP-dependent Clp protease adaptor ClpS [Spirochaetales bacterium]|nr:ATP-dependent Clp protease adaptor ClpS [Spirochaetales bacterium]